MADNRYKRSPNLHERNKAEGKLLDWLRKSNHLIPKKRRAFLNFIYEFFDPTEFTENVVKSVWVKLKHFDKKIESCPTITISSSDDEKPVQVTEVIDFDVPNTENAESFTIMKIAHTVIKTPEKRKKEIHRTPAKCRQETFNTAENQALLKKFKQQIILEELLKRDKEMLKIQQNKDKFQSAVVIEMGYAKKIQKDRVDSMAQEMLRLHREGFRDGLSSNSLSEANVCLVDSPIFIPSEDVIAEPLPLPETLGNVLSQELTNDWINYDMIYPPGEENLSDQSAKKDRKSRKRHTLPTEGKRVKKKPARQRSLGECKSVNILPKKSKRDIEADKLRQQLYIDTLIEMTLPQVIEEVNGNAKRRAKSSC